MKSRTCWNLEERGSLSCSSRKPSKTAFTLKAYSCNNELKQGEFNESVKGTTWFLLAIYSKIHKERDKLREELLNSEESGMNDFETFNPFGLQKILKFKNGC